MTRVKLEIPAADEEDTGSGLFPTFDAAFFVTLPYKARSHRTTCREVGGGRVTPHRRQLSVNCRHWREIDGASVSARSWPTRLSHHADNCATAQTRLPLRRDLSFSLHGLRDHRRVCFGSDLGGNAISAELWRILSRQALLAGGRVFHSLSRTWKEGEPR